jgi:hypothetical protein
MILANIMNSESTILHEHVAKKQKGTCRRNVKHRLVVNDPTPLSEEPDAAQSSQEPSLDHLRYKFAHTDMLEILDPSELATIMAAMRVRVDQHLNAASLEISAGLSDVIQKVTEHRKAGDAEHHIKKKDAQQRKMSHAVSVCNMDVSSAMPTTYAIL